MFSICSLSLLVLWFSSTGAAIQGRDLEEVMEISEIDGPYLNFQPLYFEAHLLAPYKVFLLPFIEPLKCHLSSSKLDVFEGQPFMALNWLGCNSTPFPHLVFTDLWICKSPHRLYPHPPLQPSPAALLIKHIAHSALQLLYSTQWKIIILEWTGQTGLNWSPVCPGSPVDLWEW